MSSNVHRGWMENFTRFFEFWNMCKRRKKGIKEKGQKHKKRMNKNNGQLKKGYLLKDQSRNAKSFF